MQTAVTTYFSCKQLLLFAHASQYTNHQPVFVFQCFTLPQYLRYRFGGQRIRVWIAVIHTFITIISAISVSYVFLHRDGDAYQNVYVY